PVTERTAVRRYTFSGMIERDTLVNHTERTFFGQASATIDPNGYLSRYDYDYNGRLTTAWLPLDFPGTDVQTLPPYEGPEAVDLFGVTHHERRTDRLHCWQEWEGDEMLHFYEKLPGAVANTVHPDTLFAW